MKTKLFFLLLKIYVFAQFKDYTFKYEINSFIRYSYFIFLPDSERIKIKSLFYFLQIQ